MSKTENELTGFERVVNAINGVPMKRRPFGMQLSMYGQNYVDCSMKDYFQRPEFYFAGQSAIVEKFSPDIITTPFALTYDGEAFGSVLKYYDNSPPQVKEPAINSYREIKNLKIPAL